MESSFRPPNDPSFQLIETFLWEPQRGVVRRDRHIARMQRTAALFDIHLPDVDACLDSLSAPGPLRVRLTVDQRGNLHISKQPFVPLSADTVWQLGVAEQRLRATDPWLGVKTTERHVYDAARATLPKTLDELIFLNEEGWLCEGTITNLFLDLGDGLMTPPLSCGVLPGVLREELIETGQVRVARLGLEALAECHALYVGNSLRGLIPARLSQVGIIVE